jgi:imidazolonepropionase-like amidohydrolase
MIRRNFLTGLAAAAGLGPKNALASLPLDGWLSQGAAEKMVFSNVTLLTSDGVIREAMGVELAEGTMQFSRSIKGGLDLGGRWLVPGFVDAGCMVGLYEVDLESGTHDEDESSGSVNADVKAHDAYNPMSSVIPTVRANGITTVVVHPRLNRLVPGHAATFSTVGLTRDEASISSDAAIQDSVGLCICLGSSGRGGGGPSSRMGIASKLRELFHEHQPSEPMAEEKKTRRWNRNEEPEPEEENLGPTEEVWRHVRDRLLPVVFKAERADDILVAVELIKAHDIRGIILGGAEAWIVAETLADAEIPVLLGPPTVQPDNFEHLNARYDNAKQLNDSGVLFAFRSGANHFARTLPSMAAVAVAHGLPHAAAIKALCLNATQILSLSNNPLISDNDLAYDANFFICEGDPLQPRNRVQRMWIQGREADLRTKQTELYEAYREL